MKAERPISLAQHTVPLWTPTEMLENAARIGYDAVSIRSIPQGVPGEAVFSLSADKGQFQAIRARIRDTGVFINDIDLAAINEQRDIAALEREFEAAAELGISGVVSSIWTQDRAMYTERFAALCELAKGYELKVHLEFVTWSEIKTVSQAAALLAETHADNARILLDMIHFYRSRCTLEELQACDPALFDLVHLCDAPAEIPARMEELISSCRHERLYPAEGDIPILSILGALPEAKIYSVEIPNTANTKTYGAFEHASKAYRAAAKLCLMKL